MSHRNERIILDGQAFLMMAYDDDGDEWFSIVRFYDRTLYQDADIITWFNQREIPLRHMAEHEPVLTLQATLSANQAVEFKMGWF